jgi:hypothetical protein
VGRDGRQHQPQGYYGHREVKTGEVIYLSMTYAIDASVAEHPVVAKFC